MLRSMYSEVEQLLKLQPDLLEQFAALLPEARPLHE